MEFPQVDPARMPPQQHTISREEAISRTRIWRENIAKLFGGTPEAGLPQIDVPKSIFIDFMDLKQLTDDFLQAGVKLSGIRLYFTLMNDNKDGKYQVTGVLVPTIRLLMAEGEALPKHLDYDFVIDVPVVNAHGEVGTGSSVYDFTMPCPSFCGGTAAELTGAGKEERV